MAQKVQVLMVDDLVRKAGNEDVPADETVRFGLDGTDYEIDLTALHAAGLREVLSDYITAGRKIRPVRTAGRSQVRDRKHPDLEKIRDWARDNGLDVKDRGRVPGRIVEQYELAHPKTEPGF